MRSHWDVIIVGARCAGAMLGAELARAGVKTLIVEADKAGADMPLSTHLVQPPGMRALDRLGVGERVRAVTPASSRFRFAVDAAEIFSEHALGGAAYCVRRATLDPLLQEAAAARGATLRFGTRVVELITEGERVAGVVVESAHGRERLTADLVVGADGARSTVAKLTGAREYLASESTRGGYFGYYPAPSSWSAPWDGTLEYRDDDLRYVFRTDGDLVVLVSAPPLAVAQAWGRAYRGKLHESLLASETTRPFALGRAPVGKVMGLLRTRFFYREAAGNGWALVGDAGHYKDFVTGHGISDALLDAERLARALLAPAREAALEHFWRERDVATLPLHLDALEKGRVGYNTPLMEWVIGCAAKTKGMPERVSRMLDREIEPDELIPMRHMLRYMALALVRGRFDVLSGFVAEGRAQSSQQRELASRVALLRTAEARLREALRDTGTTATANPALVPSTAPV